MSNTDHKTPKNRQRRRVYSVLALELCSGSGRPHCPDCDAHLAGAGERWSCPTCGESFTVTDWDEIEWRPS